MKKIIVSAVALTLLLTGCAQSYEQKFDEVVDLCVEYYRVSEPDKASDQDFDYCVEWLGEIASTDEMLEGMKEFFQEEIAKLKK